MLVLSLALVVAWVAVWFTAIIQFRQLRRWQSTERALQLEIQRVTPAQWQRVLAHHKSSIGGQLLARFERGLESNDLIDADTDYLMTLEQQRVFSELTLLAPVATAAPLGGLFGGVCAVLTPPASNNTTPSSTRGAALDEPSGRG